MDLKLNDMLPINDVTREAFSVLGQRGVISASGGHSCLECTQPYRAAANEEDMDVECQNACGGWDCYGANSLLLF